MEKFIEHNHETEHLKEIHALQWGLISEWSAGREGDKNKIAAQWIETYSVKFRVVLDRILDEEIYFWDDYQNPLFQEKILQRIKDELYEHE
ncbi:MAG: hypothetical protein V4686_00780 [Patescibacteria group bacterium]